MFKPFVFAAVLAAASSASAAPPPISAFGRLPAIEQAAIAPDGAHLAWLGGAGDDVRLTIVPVDGNRIAALSLGRLSGHQVRWAGSSYAIVRLSKLTEPINKQVYHMYRDIAADTNAKVLSRLLTNSDASTWLGDTPILRVVDAEKPKVIMQGLDWTTYSPNAADTRLKTKDTGIAPAIWRVDPVSGKGDLVDRGTAFTSSWEVDANGEPRVRFDFDFAHAYTLYGRSKRSSAWTVIQRSSDEEEVRSYLGYSDPEDAVYLARRKPDGSTAIIRHNLVDGTETDIGPAKPARHADLMWDDIRVAPVAIVTGDEKPTYEWLDAEIGAVHAKASRAFKDRAVALVGWSKDRIRFVLKVEAPDSPPTWFLLDNARGELSPIGQSYPELEGAALGQTSWITFKARDGLEIPAYLTLPPGAPVGRGSLPLIVMPHGGPAARDDYAFDYWAQFLATRGYAVLRPQFRGSWGFGDQFELAGRREWVGKMQTDLLDGISALAAQGVIDRNRVCIVGASYGGYAALAGVAFHPEAYRCAVSVAGISSLGQMLAEERRGAGEDSATMRYWIHQLGRSGGTEDLLIAASPASHAENIRAPVLLIHGEDDTTVYFDQATIMQKAMQDAGRSVELVALKGDDHYLSTSATRTQMLEAVAAFLAKNLPVIP